MNLKFWKQHTRWGSGPLKSAVSVKKPFKVRRPKQGSSCKEQSRTISSPTRRSLICSPDKSMIFFKKRNWVSSQTWYALFILASCRFHSPNSYANTKFHAGMTYILMQFHIQTRNPFLLLMAFWWVLFQISNHENIPLVMHLGLKKVIFLNMMALMRWKFAIQLMWNEHNV